MQVGSHIELLHEGDAIYYDSNTPHGMIAAEGADLHFLRHRAHPGQSSTTTQEQAEQSDAPIRSGSGKRIYHRFIHPQVDENGQLQGLEFENDDKFNFAFDIVDGMAQKDPDKLAMLHIGRNKQERRFTFRDMSIASNQAANYFKALGIRRGRPGYAGAQTALPVLVLHSGPAQTGRHRNPGDKPVGSARL